MNRFDQELWDRAYEYYIRCTVDHLAYLVFYHNSEYVAYDGLTVWEIYKLMIKAKIKSQTKNLDRAEE